MDPTITTAAPAAEPTAAPKSPDQNLTTRSRARRFAQSRAAAKPGSGQAGAASTPANAPAPAAAPAPKQPQPTKPASSEGTPAAPAALPNAPAPAAPAAAPAGTPTPAAGAQPAAADPDANLEESDGLTLLEALDGGEDGSATDAQVETWLTQLDELLQTGEHPKAIRELQKRLHAVVDQRDTERNARLEAERRLAQRQEVGADDPEGSVQAPGPMEGHPAVRQLDGQIQNTLGTIEMVERYVDAVEDATSRQEDPPQHITLANGKPWTNAAGVPVVVTVSQAREWLRQYERQLTQLQVRRETTLSQLSVDRRTTEKQTMASAVTVYPWMAKKDSAEFIEARALLHQRPGLRNDPQWPLIVGDYITGKRLRESRSANGNNGTGLAPKAPPLQKPRSTAPPPPVAGQRTAAAPAAAADGEELDKAREEYRKSPTLKNRAKIFALQRQQRNAA